MLFALYAWSIRSGFYFPVDAYWLSFILVSIPLISDIAFKHGNPKHRLIYLLAFSIILNLQYVVVNQSPVLGDSDSIFGYSLTKQILNTRWTPGMGYIYDRAYGYSFTPVMFFLNMITSMITGIPLLSVFEYLFVIGGIIVPLLAVKFFENFFDRDVSYLATAIFIATPGAILYPHYQTIALIFFTIAFYSMTKAATTRSRELLSICLLAIFAMILTHPLTTYVFLGLLASLFISNSLLRRQTLIQPSKVFTLICFVLFAIWMTFAAWTVSMANVDVLLEFLNPPSTSALTSTSVLTQSLVGETTIVTIGFVITILSAVIGFLLCARALIRRKNNSYDLVTMAIFFTPLLVLSFFFRFSGSAHNVDISHRIWAFAYLAVGVFSAICFIRLFRSIKRSISKVIVVLAILSVVMVGPIGGPLSPHNPGVIQSRFISYNGLSATTWLNAFSNNETVIGDMEGGITYCLFGGYGGQVVSIQPKLFSGGDLSHIPDKRSFKGEYLVAGTYITELAKLMGEPTEEHIFEKFDVSLVLDRVYSNGALAIYKFNNGTS